MKIFTIPGTRVTPGSGHFVTISYICSVND